MRDRAIAVVGMPSGGTSMVAGVLARLGCDLGACRTDVEPVRGYRNYECQEFEASVRDAVWPGGSITPQRTPDEGCALVGSYLARRRQRDPTAVLAVKGWGLTWCGMSSQWDDLGIAVVHVHRPFHEAIDSYLRYEQRVHPDRRGKEYVWVAANLGGQAYVLRRFLERVRPRVDWSLDGIYAEPERFVAEVCEAFALQPTAQGRSAAVAFIDPEHKGRTIADRSGPR